MGASNLLERYAHTPDEFPVLKDQTHKILKDKSIVNEPININENIINYVQDTALLISVIDGSVKSGEPFDHVVYLDKSARPVSWLVNMFWNDFAAKGPDGSPVRRPRHSYINIDRAPWFRRVGIDVSDDGRQRADGELATYWDFVNHLSNLDKKYLAEIRSLYIKGGIEKEDAEWVMSQPTELDGKRVLIVDEVSRTGATLKIAVKMYQLVFPNAVIESAYFWQPHEAALMMGGEQILTSLPVWYDPNTVTGRGIGGLDEHYYRNLYEKMLLMAADNPAVNVRKFRTYAFASSVYSAPVLNDNSEPIGLKAEKKTRELTRDLKMLHDEYAAGRLFFVPPFEWALSGRFEEELEKQGVRLIPLDASRAEAEKIRKSPDFYLNFIEKLKKM